MKRHAEVRHAAKTRYNPWTLCDYLTKDENVVIVDKAIAIQNKSDEAKFFTVLGATFGWDYSPDFKLVTVYMEYDGRTLCGGVYDMERHEKITRRLLASTIQNERIRLDRGGVGFTPYIYTEEKMNEIIESIEQTKWQ